MSEPLKRWRFDSEYHDGLVEDQTGAWYYAADVEAWLKSQRIALRDAWASQSNSDHNEVIDGLLAQLKVTR